MTKTGMKLRKGGEIVVGYDTEGVTLAIRHGGPGFMHQSEVRMSQEHAEHLAQLLNMHARKAGT